MKIASKNTISYFCGLVILIFLRYAYLAFLLRRLELFRYRCVDTYNKRKLGPSVDLDYEQTSEQTSEQDESSHLLQDAHGHIVIEPNESVTRE